MATKLDTLDERILSALQDDGRLTMKALAEQIGMSSPAVIERVRRLEERGMLTGYRGLVDPTAVGRPLSVMIHATVASDDQEAFVALLREHDAVEEVMRLSGARNYLLRAHLAIFDPDGPFAPSAFQRMAVLIQIVNASPTLNATAAAFKDTHADKALDVMGRRMGLPRDHTAVRLVADTWTRLFAASFAGMGMPGNDPIEPGVLRARMSATFALFTRTWQPWQPVDPAADPA